jgi:hypothetical protein
MCLRSYEWVRLLVTDRIDWLAVVPVVHNDGIRRVAKRHPCSLCDHCPPKVVRACPMDIQSKGQNAGCEDRLLSALT